MKSVPFVKRLKRAWQMLKSSKAQPTPVRRRKPSSKKSPSECRPSVPSSYVQLGGYVLLPDDVLPLLADAIKLDYDYVDGKRLWHVAKDHAVSVEFWSHERLNALRVAEKLEK